MSEVVYRSNVRIERVKGPIRRAYLRRARSSDLRSSWRGGGTLQSSTERAGTSCHNPGLRGCGNGGLTHGNLRRRAGGA